MIKRQILPHGHFSSHALYAFEKISRSFFLPEDKKSEAYVEAPIILDGRRIIYAPLSYACLLELLPVVSDQNIMVVGGSTGYGAALLSFHGSTIFLLESDDRYVSVAQEGFKRMGIENVVLCQGSLRDGLIKQSPFWYILVEGSIDTVPYAYFDQLHPESPGIFACAQIKGGGSFFSRFYRDDKGVVVCEPLFPEKAFYVPEFQQKEKFVF